MTIEFPMLLSQEAPSVHRPSHEPKPSSETFHRVLLAVGAQVDRGEGLMRGVVAGRGGPMNAAELIALQAGIYRYTELVDLTSKVVDRAANAVRTTLQSGG
ncbi:MAG TPA: hypothetical protein VI197_19825 [Polyangiaceae bacterium]